MSKKRNKGLLVCVDSRRRKAGVNKQFITKMLEQAGMMLNLENSQINILLVGGSEIVEVHRRYFNENTETDVISFPMNESDPETGRLLLGDVVVSVDEADKYANSGEGVRDEVFLYALHGLLHLIGYDDLDPKNKRKMFAMQRKIMTALNLVGGKSHG